MRRIIAFMLLSGVFVCSCGCKSTTKEFDFVEKAIIRESYPVRLEPEFKWNFGRLTLSTAGVFLRFAEDGCEAADYLQGVQRVQLGVYAVQNSPHSGRLGILETVEKKLEELGWENFVRVKDGDGHVSISFREINKRTASLYITIFEPDEMVILEVKGRLSKMIEKAVQEKGSPIEVKG